MNLHNYLDRERDGAPTQEDFAKSVGVSQGLVWQWLNNRTRITAERALQIERVTGGVVSKHELRPDVFGEGPSKAAAA